ncbi:MAG: S8 family serine peptidase [Bacteroidota bacterium]|nr:S8 family serine peptidase [Bacteroidota bacterium]
MNNSEKIICPLCNDAIDKLMYRFHIDNERTVIEKIKSEHPSWAMEDGICSRCVDYYYVQIVCKQQILPEIGPHFPVKSKDDFVVLPTGLRLDADPRYTGKGVTICFIDSGFHPHPDLVATRNRLKTTFDVTGNGENEKASVSGEFQHAAWHGTMTTVVCAGDGFLSKGLYKGIASDAELVLIKVQDKAGNIRTENIVRALQWVLDNYIKYGIRIVNISLGDQHTGSYKDSEVDCLAEQLIKNGISVVAAAGNEEFGRIHPPADSPNVITVGGIDDDNQLGNPFNKAYHSSYGMTADNLMKPELVAHAIWIAAPILTDTAEAEEARILHSLLSLTGQTLQQELISDISKTKLQYDVLLEPDMLKKKEMITRRIQSAKYISPYYMHVDGTSFAAPVVSAVIAQMLEARPELTPMQIRHLLFDAAKRIPGIPAERQGYGLVRPRKSILKILKREMITNLTKSPYVNRMNKTIEFVFYSHCAERVSLSGCFNEWARDVLLLEPGLNGLWKIEIPMLPEGRYTYKFLLDEKIWIEDINNPYREPDGFTGFNSLLIIESGLN